MRRAKFSLSKGTKCWAKIWLEENFNFVFLYQEMIKKCTLFLFNNLCSLQIPVSDINIDFPRPTLSTFFLKNVFMPHFLSKTFISFSLKLITCEERNFVFQHKGWKRIWQVDLRYICQLTTRAKKDNTFAVCKIF